MRQPSHGTKPGNCRDVRYKPTTWGTLLLFRMKAVTGEPHSPPDKSKPSPSRFWNHWGAEVGRQLGSWHPIATAPRAGAGKAHSLSSGGAKRISRKHGHFDKHGRTRWGWGGGLGGRESRRRGSCTQGAMVACGLRRTGAVQRPRAPSQQGWRGQMGQGKPTCTPDCLMPSRYLLWQRHRNLPALKMRTKLLCSLFFLWGGEEWACKACTGHRAPWSGGMQAPGGPRCLSW